MELTIKELAAYLPYEVLISFDKENHKLHWNVMKCSHLAFETENYKEYRFKPILYPLDYLQDFLSQIYNELKFGSIIIKKMDFATIVKYQLMGETFTDIVYSQGSFNNCPMYVFDKLVEMKLDVFNLIENNLAIAVTEDFNPYK